MGVFVGFVADVYEEGRGVKGSARRVKGRNSREGREGGDGKDVGEREKDEEVREKRK